MVHSPLGLIMRFTLIVLLLVVHMITSRQAHAEIYIDIGIAYIDEVDVISKGKVNLGGFVVEAEYTTRLEVDDWVPMLRVGFIHKGWAIEYDTIGAPSMYIPRINLFYRSQWK